ncbi:hypothetical protein N7463_009165 [Penicillium fimorum]|uniref:Zn(2)-C6 fungal-type domain-containing protein n=1 Tax=Penicillium fimorum TaxID=1882269 RepID=A0A9W9XQ76_9EURO|nr:hypothetical protein N7463_009165 [Penicillium fimorum]
MSSLPSKTSTMQRSNRLAMSAWTNQQQKDRPVPQLSCVLCRDRKLKCDKLDPCSNCTSSGVACVPIYRPRLPRGRHARNVQSKISTPPDARRRGNSSNSTTAPAVDNESHDTQIDRLERLVQDREAGELGLDTEVNGLQELISLVNDEALPDTALTTHYFGTISRILSSRIRRLECLVQEKDGMGTKRKAKNKTTDARSSPETDDCRGGTLVYDKLEVVRAPQDLETQHAPAILTSNYARQSPELSSNDIWADIMDHDMHNQPEYNALELPSSVANEGGEDNMGSFGRKNSISNGFNVLHLLGIGNSLSPSFISLPRDRLASSKLCQVYLQNVDPIIKILHRPSLSKWMLEGGTTYLGSSEDNYAVIALESAVCYTAANTMTEGQCQVAFQKTKSSIMAMRRKMCEDAIENAGLLTTRDITVLQAFILYLESSDGAHKGETFFQQQLRLRLWLTGCLIDLQASFAQASEPLVTYREVACVIPHVAHINDSNFDVDTTHPVASHEELTDTTFALVTYHVQVAGRLLNFGPECSTTTERHELAQEVQQPIFTLLRYCDPESSSYAWFTWHSTQSIISAVRLSELLPFRCGQPGSHLPLPLSRAEGDTTLLSRALQNLEKAQLIRDDPRGDGFRWYITTPWLALSTAISECNSRDNLTLVRRAWPVIETSYRQYEASMNSNQCQAQSPMAQLMNDTREKLPPLLQENGAGFSDGQTVDRGGVNSLRAPVPLDNLPIDPLLTGGSLRADSEALSVGSLLPFGQQSWTQMAMSTDGTSARDGMIFTALL